MADSVTIVEGADRALSALARSAGLDVTATITVDEMTSLEGSNRPPDLLMIDLRGRSEVPPAVGALRRRFTRMGVVIVASQLDPALMLEAMRAGVSEFVTEPLDALELRAAVERMGGAQSHQDALQGQVLAFVGAKGGVGATTLAVNVAAALAAGRPGQVLLADLHVAAHGDSALLMGVEPRFSVVDALDNTYRLDAAYLKSLVVPSKSGCDVLASPDRPALRPPEGSQVTALIERLSAHYACVVLDVPRSDFGLLDSLGNVTALALVLNQELPTIRRAAQLGSLLRQRYGQDRVAAVVSRYDARADIGQEDIERVVGLPVWGLLPSDYRKVIAAANSGKPLVTDDHSRLAAAVVKLAHRLSGSPEREESIRPATGSGTGKGIGTRLGNLFT